MDKILEILIGLLLLLIPVYAWIGDLWGVGTAALILLKGGIIWILLLVGLVLLLMGITDLKN